MSVRETQLCERCAVLQKELRKVRQEAAYYRQIAEDTGKRRLREIDQLGRYIRDLRRAEASLRQSEDRYRSLIESCPLPVFVHCQGVFRYLNPAALKLARSKNSTTLMYRKLGDFIHPDDRARFQKLLKSTTQNPQKSVNACFRVLLGDKKTYDVEVIALPIRYRDEAARLVFCIDRTEQLRVEHEKAELQERLNRSRKMEALGLLAGGVAHDLNNILSGVVTYPELLLMDLTPDHKLRQPLETIRESGKRAAAITKDLVTVSRGIASSREAANLNDIIAEYLKSAEYRQLELYHPGVRLRTELEPRLLNISCSPINVKKSLMNLIINAAEALEESGEVVVSTRNQYVDTPVHGYDHVAVGEYAVLSVADTGCGISAEDAERIFEPFYTRKVMGRSGTGLGLMVVWNTMQDHQGYIDVKSTPNGTCFDLFFPVTREERLKAPAAVPQKALMGAGETVLVVDDEKSQREIAAAILRRFGYTVMTAESGEKALTRMQAGCPDMVLLDMVMEPGIDGLETYRRMLGICPGQKAVVASGYTEHEAVRQVLQLGAGRYLKKPYTVETIALAIKAGLGKLPDGAETDFPDS